MIVKLQRPLSSNQKNPPALAYDQHRTFSVFVPMTMPLTKMFGEKAKIYAEARLVGADLEILNIVPDRGW